MNSNFTEDGKEKLFLLCSPVSGITYHLIGLTVINIFLSITAILGNTLILAALHKESYIHPPSKLLLRSLATTDLCVGLISEPLHIIYEMALVNGRWNICRYSFVSSFIAGYILGAVSLLILTAISVDRLLALLLGLGYRQAVTLKRTYVIVIAFWVFSTVATTLFLLNYLITLWCSYIVISLCLVTSTFSYSKIFHSLRQHQNQVQDLVHQERLSQTSPLNKARYRKAVNSALWLQLALLVCYLPHGVVTALWTNTNQLSSSVFFANQCTKTLAFLNSSLNPILYCWKMVDVRQAVKDTIRQLFRPLF